MSKIECFYCPYGQKTTIIRLRKGDLQESGEAHSAAILIDNKTGLPIIEAAHLMSVFYY